MTTRRAGSPARGPSPPSCRSRTTSPSRRSPGVSRPDRPRPPPPRSLLLHRPPPLLLPPPSLVLLPPGRPEEEGPWTSPATGWWWWHWWPCFWEHRYRWGPSGHADTGSGARSCPCRWKYALAILQQPMVRAHLDVAVPGSGRGALSSAPAGDHIHWRCSTLRAVLYPARSAQPAADLACVS